jgi:hypothetical protein
MVEAVITNELLKVLIRGTHKLWAMKNSVEIPLTSIESAHVDPETARAGPEGTRNSGTHVPGVITAGTYNAGVKRTFWDVHNPDNAIRIKLKSGYDLFAGIEGRYDELIVEVDNPAETVDRINRALLDIAGHPPKSAA